MMKRLPLGRRVWTLTLTALLIAGCGGGGGSTSTGGLAFRIQWEQEGARRGARFPRRFVSEIPLSVDAVKFLVQAGPEDDRLECCIAVLRGSPTFAERLLNIASVPSGVAIVTISGFPDAFAPVPEEMPICETVPAGRGERCDATRRGPFSFFSEPALVDVAGGGFTEVADIPLLSVPFLRSLTPGPGGTTFGQAVPFEFSVVDAANAVSPDIVVVVRTGDPPAALDVEIETFSPCNERIDPPIPCSETGADLDTRGFIVAGRTTNTAPISSATIRVVARNDADPPQVLDTEFDVIVVPTSTTSTTSTTVTSTTTSTTTTTTMSPPITTTTTMSPPTTTTSTTSTTSTTTTTTMSPPTTTTTTTSSTTTLPVGNLSCVVTFRVDDIPPGFSLGALQFAVDYSRAPGTFAAGPSCTKQTPGGFTTFHDDGADTLRAGYVSFTGLQPSEAELVTCMFDATSPPQMSDFTVTVEDATGVGDTRSGGGLCGAPTTGLQPPFASDALHLLQAAIGLLVCADPCECSPSGSGVPRVNDALQVLVAAVSKDFSSFACPGVCGSMTVTPPTADAASVSVSNIFCGGRVP